MSAVFAGLLLFVLAIPVAIKILQFAFWLVVMLIAAIVAAVQDVLQDS